MRKAFTYLAFLLSVGGIYAQTIDLSTATHLQTFSQCGGTFIDNPVNYANNFERAITICPSVPGQYVSVSFTSFDTQAGGDILFAFNGDQGGTLINSYSGVLAPFTITSSAPNGCLSFRFTSNLLTNRPGWTANITCTPIPGANPPGGSPQDCVGGQGMTICSNNTFNANSSGVGLQELSQTNRGCLATNERQSSWYYFSPVASGFVAFTISPAVSTDDYDFAIWGPYNSVVCPMVSGDVPTRCSYSGLGGNTGLLNGAGDNVEGAGGDKFVEDLNVIAGEVYVMVIDNFTVSGQPFSLIFTPGSAPLDCTPLPVVLTQFEAYEEQNHNKIRWTTVSETNNDYFIIEKSDDANEWTELGRRNGAGNSNQTKQYTMVDQVPYPLTYYRLKQVDFDGATTTFNIISVERQNGGATSVDMLSYYPNPVADHMMVETYMEGDNLITIVDQTGKPVYNKIVNGPLLSDLDMSTLNPGLYFMKIENNGKVENSKIIVQ